MDKLSHLAQRVAGRMSGPDQSFSGFAIDTRRIERGEVFVALAGEKVDGHEFVAMAARQGAAGALVEKWQDVDLPQVVVPDVLAALQHYASHWRSQFDIPLIGVTGSNGKTTTKEMLAAILGQAGPVLATRGNFNNHIGMPLTLCELRETHRMAVIEMGANHPGEIAELAAIAKPNAGIVTLAGAAHLEGFGSVETVARTKGGMFEALPQDGLAIINHDDDYAPLWREMASHCRQ
ncbi:MAG: UDP-N-acetylmuramoyl-tripeptide--D-alanyl-D-alanine ligase, partial [Nevskiales bacterium]